MEVTRSSRFSHLKATNVISLLDMAGLLLFTSTSPARAGVCPCTQTRRNLADV